MKPVIKIQDSSFVKEKDEMSGSLKNKFALVLPVLFYEYLAISITKSLIPTMVIDAFGKHSYLAVGLMETSKGILAFIACPLFGKLSDQIGRKYCLLCTVLGTTMPICLLAFTSNMYLYAFAMGLSGFFSATFPVTFAYISDCVEKNDRAPAYGLALATFGLSFCIGPLLGSYLAAQLGSRAVFISSLCLILIDIFYIIVFLPESAKNMNQDAKRPIEKLRVAIEYLPYTWNFTETFRIFNLDPFLTNLALIVFLYYTSVWALVSTLMVYVVRFLSFEPIALGWLLSSFGVATMFSEGVLVRICVPILGEINSMRLGLFSFAVQCVVISMSTSSDYIYASIVFSMVSHLVYPSMSSLVSKLVDENMQGEALGALNGIKALTEGFGPLIFGLLMALFEDNPM